MHAHISLSVSHILDDIYARSALSHRDLRPGLLTRAHESALRQTLIGAFGQSVLAILPHVVETNISELDSSSSHMTLTLDIPDESSDSLPGVLRDSLERAVANFALSIAYSGFSDSQADACRKMADSLNAGILDKLGSSPRSVWLSEWF